MSTMVGTATFSPDRLLLRTLSLQTQGAKNYLCIASANENPVNSNGPLPTPKVLCSRKEHIVNKYYLEKCDRLCALKTKTSGNARAPPEVQLYNQVTTKLPNSISTSCLLWCLQLSRRVPGVCYESDRKSATIFACVLHCALPPAGR